MVERDLTLGLSSVPGGAIASSAMCRLRVKISVAGLAFLLHFRDSQKCWIFRVTWQIYLDLVKP